MPKARRQDTELLQGQWDLGLALEGGQKARAVLEVGLTECEK